MILFILISMGFMNELYASPENNEPHSPFSIFHFRKKQRGVIKAHGGITRGTPPKVRSGYKINKK
jgi:hypothetical protein